MNNLNATIGDITLEKIKIARQVAQNDLVLMSRRMKVHQKIYDSIKIEYTKKLNRYQKLDLSYAMNTKITICPPKLEKKRRKTKTSKNIMPSKVKALLDTLPKETRKNIIAAYEED